MIELKLTVDIPALDKLAPILEAYVRSGLAARKAEEPVVAPYTAPDRPLPTATTPVTPVTPPVATGDPGPAVTTTTAAPTTAPSYTIAQISRAGAALITAKPAMIAPLQELLQRFGVSTAQELPQDRLGEFAAELRRLGATL